MNQYQRRMAIIKAITFIVLCLTLFVMICEIINHWPTGV